MLLEQIFWQWMTLDSNVNAVAEACRGVAGEIPLLACPLLVILQKDSREQEDKDGEVHRDGGKVGWGVLRCVWMAERFGSPTPKVENHTIVWAETMGLQQITREVVVAH